MNSISGIILAGGESTRMGSDKAQIIFQGKKLIEYPIELLVPFCNEILISANSTDYNGSGFQVVKDEYPKCGPMGGIYSALKRSSNEWSLVVSCDTPFISSCVISRLNENKQNFQCVVPVNKGKVEPLVALYNKLCLPSLLQNLQSGNYKMIRLLGSLASNFVDVSDLANKNPSLFTNINSPGDLT